MTPPKNQKFLEPPVPQNIVLEKLHSHSPSQQQKMLGYQTARRNLTATEEFGTGRTKPSLRICKDGFGEKLLVLRWVIMGITGTVWKSATDIIFWRKIRWKILSQKAFRTENGIGGGTGIFSRNIERENVSRVRTNVWGVSTKQVGKSVTMNLVLDYLAMIKEMNQLVWFGQD